MEGEMKKFSIAYVTESGTLVLRTVEAPDILSALNLVFGCLENSVADIECYLANAGWACEYMEV